MSQRHTIQDATGIIASDEIGNALIVASAENPTSTRNNEAGFSKGCLFIDTANAKLYVNDDSETTANWEEAT